MRWKSLGTRLTWYLIGQYCARYDCWKLTNQLALKSRRYSFFIVLIYWQKLCTWYRSLLTNSASVSNIFFKLGPVASVRKNLAKSNHHARARKMTGESMATNADLWKWRGTRIFAVCEQAWKTRLGVWKRLGGDRRFVENPPPSPCGWADLARKSGSAVLQRFSLLCRTASAA